MPHLNDDAAPAIESLMYTPLPPCHASADGPKRPASVLEEASTVVEFKRLKENQEAAYMCPFCLDTVVNEPQIIFCSKCGEGGHVYHIRCVIKYLEQELKTVDVVDLSEIRRTVMNARCPNCRREIEFIFVTGFYQLLKYPFIPPGIDTLEMHLQFKKAYSFLQHLAAFCEDCQFPMSVDDVEYKIHDQLGIPQNVFILLHCFLNVRFNPIDFILSGRLNLLHLEREEAVVRRHLLRVQSSRSLFDD